MHASHCGARSACVCVCDGAQVRSSKALKQVIEYALAIGNYLNGGTNKGAAWGFKVDSLNKLIGTKTLDNKSTLLHYMARKVRPSGRLHISCGAGQHGAAHVWLSPDSLDAALLRCAWR